jgi:antirestriction protein ArdC
MNYFEYFRTNGKLAGWLQVLKEDSKLIFKAAAEAQKSVDYILNRKQTGE